MVKLIGFMGIQGCMPRTERRSRDSVAFRRNAAIGYERRASRKNIHDFPLDPVTSVRYSPPASAESASALRSPAVRQVLTDSS